MNQEFAFRSDVYQQMALRTESSHYAATTKQMRLLHAAIGIGTEAAEFFEGVVKSADPDPINMCEEGGDLQWYVAVACDVLGWRMHQVARAANDNVLEKQRQAERSKTPLPEDSLERLGASLVFLAGQVLDVAKRHVFYGLDLDTHKLSTLFISLMEHCIWIADHCDTTLDVMQRKNILKLLRRYPGKFNPDDAANRDTVAEIAAMEDAAAIDRVYELAQAS